MITGIGKFKNLIRLHLKRFCGLYMLMFLLLNEAGAQTVPGRVTTSQMEQDSLRVFPLDAFYDKVLEHHPMVKSANLLSEQAAMQIREARGAFDPKLEAVYDRKVFQDKHYYTAWRNELKIPLLINTDLKVGYEQHHGMYLNPEKRVPDAGLMYAGISVPLGQGMITDQRRTNLRLANLDTRILEAERIKLLNKLLYEAAKDYWNWSLAFYQLQISQEGVVLARFRFNGIRSNVEEGEAAPIDSVEAKITLQNREIDLVQRQLDYRNAVLQLSTYLWDEEGNPQMIADGLAPDTLWQTGIQREQLESLEVLSELARRQHPDIQKLVSKMQQLEVEERLYRELLKPVIDVQYNYLNLPSSMFNELSQQALTQNYKLGLAFSFPLLLRKERAKLQLNRVKQQQNYLALNSSRREVDNVLQQAYNDFLTLERILQAQQSIVVNYERMLEGELEKFNAGESSLFLVNQRENSLLESRIKLLSLSEKYQKARAAVMWSAGLSVPDFAPVPVPQGIGR